MDAAKTYLESRFGKVLADGLMRIAREIASLVREYPMPGRRRLDAATRRVRDLEASLGSLEGTSLAVIRGDLLREARSLLGGLLHALADAKRGSAHSSPLVKLAMDPRAQFAVRMHGTLSQLNVDLQPAQLLALAVAAGVERPAGRDSEASSEDRLQWTWRKLVPRALAAAEKWNVLEDQRKAVTSALSAIADAAARGELNGPR